MLQILLTWGRVVEGNVVPEAHYLRTLDHTDVTWWPGDITHKISLLFDTFLRAVDLGLAGVMMVRVER